MIHQSSFLKREMGKTIPCHEMNIPKETPSALAFSHLQSLYCSTNGQKNERETLWDFHLRKKKNMMPSTLHQPSKQNEVYIFENKNFHCKKWNREGIS